MTDDDYAEIRDLVHHIVVDWVGGANPDHLEELVQHALGVSAHRTYLVLTTTCSLTAHLVRALLADTLALAEAHKAEAFFGLGVDLKPDTDVTSTSFRGKQAGMQAMTAACNNDRETAAAVVMALVHSEDGPEASVHALVGVLEVFAQLYRTPEGHAAAEFLGIGGL